MAGFVLIFGMLHLAYTQSAPTDEDIRALRAENASLWTRVAELEGLTEKKLWTVAGEVRRRDSTAHSGIEISILPPQHQGLSLPGGLFHLPHVELAKGRHLELHLHTEGYYDEIVTVETDNFTDGYISLDPVSLERQPSEEIVGQARNVEPAQPASQPTASETQLASLR